jgi:hypothetical protein
MARRSMKNIKNVRSECFRGDKLYTFNREELKYEGVTACQVGPARIVGFNPE